MGTQGGNGQNDIISNSDLNDKTSDGSSGGNGTPNTAKRP
jgi:MFS family permease